MYIEETFRSTGVEILFKADAASVKSSVGVVKVLKRRQKMKSRKMRRSDLNNLCFLWRIHFYEHLFGCVSEAVWS